MALAHADRDRDVRRRLGRLRLRRPAGRRSRNFLNAQAFARFASYDLSVIPLFMLMGKFATQGGMSKALFEFASSVMGRFRGGLAMAAVLACARLRRDLRLLGRDGGDDHPVALPEMRRHGYSGRLATGTLAAGGTLGILIPPSVLLVIYAILAEQNIAKLFAAAMVPGIIATFGYMRRDRGLRAAASRPGAREPTRATARRAPAMRWPASGRSRIIFVIVFGGIYGGMFTPTEGAAVGAAATFVAGAAQARDRPAAQVRALLLAHRRNVGDDLPDLPRRRHDELCAGADADAGAARRRSSRASACRRCGRRRRSAVLRRARLR